MFNNLSVQSGKAPTLARYKAYSPEWLPRWRTGMFYSNPLGHAVTTAALANNVVYFLPIYVPNFEGVTVTSIGVEITTTGAATSGRIGVYELNDPEVTGRKVFDSGSFAAGSLGFVPNTVSAFLMQGWYLAGCVFNGTVTVRGTTSNQPINIHGAGYISSLAAESFLTRWTLTNAETAYFTDVGLPKYISFNPKDTPVYSGSNSPRIMIGI